MKPCMHEGLDWDGQEHWWIYPSIHTSKCTSPVETFRQTGIYIRTQAYGQTEKWKDRGTEWRPGLEEETGTARPNIILSCRETERTGTAVDQERCSILDMQVNPYYLVVEICPRTHNGAEETSMDTEICSHSPTPVHIQTVYMHVWNMGIVHNEYKSVRQAGTHAHAFTSYTHACMQVHMQSPQTLRLSLMV